MLVLSGPDITRHLALPPTGRSPEWIANEMEKMDRAGGKKDSWKEGRLSGAVYRTCLATSSWSRTLLTFRHYSSFASACLVVWQ